MLSALKTKPLPLGKTVLYLVVPAVILYITHYYAIPAWVEYSGRPYFEGYLIGHTVTMGSFLVAALVGYRREGHPFTWEAFRVRYRLGKMGRADWLWTAAIIVVVLAIYFGLGFTGEWVKSVPFLAPREAWPPDFGPGGTGSVVPGEFMGMPVKGQWWLVLAYFVSWFLNIFGEELWFRGYLLPRQELAFGRAGWVVNGLMFTLNHLWQPWILIAILPSSLLLAYVVQSRKNTCIGLIQHGFVNILALFFLIGGVVGLA